MLAISWLLIGESLWTAMWLAQRLGTLAIYDRVALTLLAARVIVAIGQVIAGFWLQRAHPSARPLASIAFASSFTLLIFELGLRLGPTSVVPGWEWIYVGGYGVYAAIAILVLRRSR